MLIKILLSAATGFLAALLVDLHAYAQARQTDPNNVKFDWKLASTRWFIGAGSGILAALGIQQAGA